MPTNPASTTARTPWLRRYWWVLAAVVGVAAVAGLLWWDQQQKATPEAAFREMVAEAKTDGIVVIMSRTSAEQQRKLVNAGGAVLRLGRAMPDHHSTPKEKAERQALLEAFETWPEERRNRLCFGMSFDSLYRERFREGVLTSVTRGDPDHATVVVTTVMFRGTKNEQEFVDDVSMVREDGLWKWNGSEARSGPFRSEKESD